MRRTPRSMAGILSGGATTDAPLAAVLRQASVLRILEDALRQHLPEPLNQHFRVARVEAPARLVLVTDSAVWATQLRYQSAVLLEALARAGGAACHKVEIKIGPLSASPPRPAPQPPLTAAAAQFIRRTADHVGDEELAAALRQLALRGQGH